MAESAQTGATQANQATQASPNQVSQAAAASSVDISKIGSTLQADLGQLSQGDGVYADLDNLTSSATTIKTSAAHIDEAVSQAKTIINKINGNVLECSLADILASANKLTSKVSAVSAATALVGESTAAGDLRRQQIQDKLKSTMVRSDPISFHNTDPGIDEWSASILKLSTYISDSVVRYTAGDISGFDFGGINPTPTPSGKPPPPPPKKDTKPPPKSSTVEVPKGVAGTGGAAAAAIAVGVTGTTQQGSQSGSQSGKGDSGDDSDDAGGDPGDGKHHHKNPPPTTPGLIYTESGVYTDSSTTTTNTNNNADTDDDDDDDDVPAFVSQANRHVRDELVSKQNELRQQREQIASLQQQQQTEKTHLADLQAQLANAQGDTAQQIQQVIKLVQANQNNINTQLVLQQDNMTDLMVQVHTLHARLALVAPGVGANLTLIASLEGTETSDAILHATYHDNNSVNCVNWVCSQMPIPPGIATNASEWVQNAIHHPEYGITVGTQPLAGSVLVMQPTHSYADKRYGHVMYVDHVENGQVWITDNTHHTPVLLSSLTRETTGPNINYLYFPWQTQV